MRLFIFCGHECVQGMSDFELILELRYAANLKPLSLPPINRLPIASNID